jgi:hypothetical protein
VFFVITVVSTIGMYESLYCEKCAVHL